MNPREHRYVRKADGNRMIYNCGCVNEIHSTGVLHSIEKCKSHRKQQRSPGTLSADYYRELGVFDGQGIPTCALHLRELEEALGRFEGGHAGRLALEVGPGASMYAPGLLAAGYTYHAVEPSEWAAKWTSSTFDVMVTVGTLETFGGTPGSYSLILAAHCLEHMTWAPHAIRDCVGLLVPGGELWIVVPDDEDPLNPDHLWFFSEESLRHCLEYEGMSVDRLEVRRHVEQEQFLYARATKP